MKFFFNQNTLWAKEGSKVERLLLWVLIFYLMFGLLYIDMIICCLFSKCVLVNKNQDIFEKNISSLTIFREDSS